MSNRSSSAVGYGSPVEASGEGTSVLVSRKTGFAGTIAICCGICNEAQWLILRGISSSHSHHLAEFEFWNGAHCKAADAARKSIFFLCVEMLFNAALEPRISVLGINGLDA